ncbi:MAG: TonB family protein [Bacteroidetes bacterium]|nr:TonB family protein [Bacteroidota bacterium]
MALYKHPGADLRASWKSVLELNLSFAIGTVILFFLLSPERIAVQNFSSAATEPDVLLPPPVTTQAPKEKEPVRPSVLLLVPDDSPVADDVVIAGNEDPLPLPSADGTVNQEETEGVEFELVENLPEPVGGLRAIQEKVVYPELARKARIEGTVVIRVLIDEKGTVVSAEIMKDIGGGCADAAVKAVTATRFLPGLQRDKPVKTKIAIPVVFRLR